MSSAVPAMLRSHRAGVVHSVFGSSLNIAVGDDLVHIGATSAPLSSFGIAMEDADIRRLVDDCRAGDRLVIAGETLRVYPSLAMPITIAIDSAVRVDLRIPTHLRTDALVLVATELDCIDLPAHIGLAIDADLAAIADRARSGAVVAEWGSWLVGRGLGLTPAGDDILLGYELILRAAGHSPVARVADLQAGRTTDVSQAYSRMLARGIASEPFVALLGAAEDGDLAALRCAINAIIAIGHTSGYDHLFGIALGIAAIHEAMLLPAIAPPDRMALI